MKYKAKTWNYCWPDDPQPGLLHLEPPALSGEATFWIQCGGGTSEEQNKIADRIAALWNMAERLGLATEEIESGNVETKLKAAPDMLEVLTKAEDMINRSVSGMAKYDVLDWTGLLVQMQSIIRKARG